MYVRILKVSTKELIDASILERRNKLPGLQEGWQFSFDKHVRKAHSHAFVLVAEETPDSIEGCLIFQLKDKQIPYMAFLERRFITDKNPKGMIMLPDA